MAIEFREVAFPPLEGLTVAAPNGAIIGIIGEDGTGKQSLLRLAAGLEQPVSGQVIAALRFDELFTSSKRSIHIAGIRNCRSV